MSSSNHDVAHALAMRAAIVLWVAIGGAVARAQTPDETAAALAQKALTNTCAVDFVRELTTLIGPRLAGSDAEKRAAAWAKDRLAKMGFDKVWIEPFPIAHGWARGIEEAEVVSPAPQRLVVTALGGSVPTPPAGIEAGIALFRTYDAMLAAPTGALTGKIAVVTQPMTTEQGGFGYGAANKIRTHGPAEAARRGAIAYLHRSLGTDSHRMPHAGVTDYADGVPKIPAAALSVPDAEQLERLVTMGQPVRVRIVLTPRDLGPVSSQNVIAELRGRERPDEIVLLGAHLDSWDLGTGALDDGAGLGIEVAAAKLIQELPQRPKRTLRVVLFGSEEPGLLGGAAYARMHKDEARNHVVAAEPDEGQGPVLSFRTGVADPAEPTLDRIRKALAPLRIAAGDNHSRGTSDIGPIVEAGVPAATLEPDSSDYFDYHHTPDDTFDKIQPGRINQSVAAYAVFAYLAAELDGDYRKGSAGGTSP
jgi:Zn-dependent M28 family amino/carboxypeptidase